jgi:Arc/MetJ family transcription regulator
MLSLMPEAPVRTTVTLDDELLARAEQLTGIQERSVLVRRGIEALIARETAIRLARLGGSDKTAKAAPRSRATR